MFEPQQQYQQRASSEILNHIFNVPIQSDVEGSLSHKMKDTFTYNEYTFLTNTKLTELSRTDDVEKVISLLRKLIEPEEPHVSETTTDLESTRDFIHSVLTHTEMEARGLTTAVVMMDGNDISAASYELINDVGKIVSSDYPDFPVPTTKIAHIDKIANTAYDELGVSYPLILIKENIRI